MYIIAKHHATGKCQVLPVIFKSENEGREHLLTLLEKEKKRGFNASFVNRLGDKVVVAKEGANCFEKEYILQKLTFKNTIYAEAEPLRNYCRRTA